MLVQIHVKFEVFVVMFWNSVFDKRLAGWTVIVLKAVSGI